jgi:hypothetical protein
LKFNDADFVLLIGCAHTLSHFLNLKTPTEDSRLRHERAFFITLDTIEKLACLILLGRDFITENEFVLNVMKDGITDTEMIKNE